MPFSEDADAARERTLWMVCAGTLLVLMTYTAPAAVLPQMAASLGAGPQGRTWLLNGITLGLAGALLIAGDVADRRGRRETFLVGVALLAATGVAAAVARDPEVFVAARVLQGVASAAVLAAGLGLIGQIYAPGPALNRATARWGAALSAGVAIGPIASAGLAHLFGWQSFYLVIAVLGAIVAVAAKRIRANPRTAMSTRLDVLGAIIFALGVALLLWGVTAARTGWLQSTVVLPLAGAVVLLLVFLVRQRRSAIPMLDPGLFTEPRFRSATLGALFNGIAVIGPMNVFPALVQHSALIGSLVSALLLAGWSMIAFAASMRTYRLSARFSARARLATSLTLCAVGDAFIVGLAGTHSWLGTVPGLVLSGLGAGLLNATLARAAVESVPPTRTAMGAAANNTVRYIGSALGVAFIVLVPADEVMSALLLAAALAVLGAISVVLVGRVSRASKVSVIAGAE
jgi:MFS family permease